MINLGFIWALFLHFIQQVCSLTYELIPTSRAVSVFAVWLPWLGSLHSPPHTPPPPGHKISNVGCTLVLLVLNDPYVTYFSASCCTASSLSAHFYKNLSSRGIIHWLICIYFTLIIFMLTETINLSFGISSPIF